MCNCVLAFLLRENDLCRLLPLILARITARSFALNQGHLEPAKSWTSWNQKCRSLQTPDFISAPFSAAVNNPAAPLQRSTFIQALCLSRCLQRGLFSMDTRRLIAFLAAFRRGNAHQRAGSAASSAAAYRVTPRCPGGERAAAAPVTLERGRDGKRSLRPPAESHCVGEAVNLCQGNSWEC